MKIATSAAPAHAAKADVLVQLVGKDWREDLAALDDAFDGALIPWLEDEAFDKSVVRAPTFGHLTAKNLLIVPAASGLSEAGRKAGRAVRNGGFHDIAVAGLHGSAQLFLEAFSEGAYEFDTYKPASSRKDAPAVVTFLGTEPVASDSALTRSKWQGWARDLVNGPPADIYPESFANIAVEALEGLPHVTIEVWDFERCRKENMVGIVAVGQGSDRPGCMIRASYNPPGATQHIAFVGKGVTFDSGGLSLKPSAGMQTMRCDMGGGAVVLGAFGAIAELGTKVRVDCFVGAVENMNGPNSYKLGDILTYRNGVTVEVHNTDAEGRLVLADCLIEASNTPGVTTIVDAATLTGACVVALGEDFTGLFTTNDSLADELSAASKADDEGLWRLPLHAPYRDKLKGSWSQIKNVGGRDAGASTAASFLEYFVSEDVRWAHLDVAGSSWRDNKSGSWAAGATGQMVRALTTWVTAL